MSKKGFMKKLLGGVMAVSFAAAACFATPVTAEAATPWETDTRNRWEREAAEYQKYAEEAVEDARFYAGERMYWMREQLNAEASIAQTTAQARQYLAVLDYAGQAANLLPQPYRSAMWTTIGTQQNNLRQQAYDFIDNRYLDRELAIAGQKYYEEQMKLALDASQFLMGASMASAAYGATVRQYNNAVTQLARQADAAYANYLSYFMPSPYGF